VRLDEVELEHPPANPPPIYTGVRGPKSLKLSGEVADGTILVERSGPTYVRWARERIDEGRQAAGRTDEHRVTVYALWGDPVEPAHPDGERLTVRGRDDVDALGEAGADAVILVPSSDPAAAERELEQAAGKLLG
jgi:alkanesulfonate monooxygenase SsuD/methylene tetrahydromethanopterin reductase-like flavin-dependent oxidoreductase (luciferase family)